MQGRPPPEPRPPPRCQAPPGTRAVARSTVGPAGPQRSAPAAEPAPLSLHTGTHRDIIRAHMRALCAVAAMTA
jgi:hypothetical protein